MTSAAAGAAPRRSECARAQADRDRSLQVQAGHVGLPDAAAGATLSVRYGDQEGRSPDAGGRSEASSPSWSPDGKSIAFMGSEGKDAERYNNCNVYVMEARAGAAPRKITQYDGQRSSAGRGRPEWSPDGSRLGVPAKLRRETGRLQHEPPRGGCGGRRRAEDLRATSSIAPFRAPRFTHGRHVDSVPGGRRSLGVSRARAR